MDIASIALSTADLEVNLNHKVCPSTRQADPLVAWKDKFCLSTRRADPLAREKTFNRRTRVHRIMGLQMLSELKEFFHMKLTRLRARFFPSSKHLQLLMSKLLKYF